MTDDKKYQLKNLEKIFSEGKLSPVFKRNPNFPIKEGVARIAYSDVMDFKYVIRSDTDFSCDPFWSEDTEVIAEYYNLQAMVDDGWRLD